jgi:cytochrome P450
MVIDFWPCIPAIEIFQAIIEMSLSPTKTGLAAIVILALWAIYRLILSKLHPRVLPGVPHNTRNVKVVFGDMSAVAAYTSKTGCTQSEAVFEVVNRGPTQSPIAQLLTPSFMTQAILMIDDPREVEDILRRRGREFDRSSMTAAFFEPLLPKASISQFTTPELKTQKKLWADSITSDFLAKVVAPHACRAASRLVDIWRLKAPSGDEFEAQPHFLDATMDLMWAIVLGSDLGVLNDRLQSTAGELKKQSDLEHLGSSGTGVVSSKLGKAAESSREMFFEVTKFLEDESSYIRSGSAAWRLKFVKFTPRYRRVRKTMNSEMQRLVAAARDRFQQLGQSQGACRNAEETCAMDLVLRRELLAAEKADFVHATDIEQELMLFMIAVSNATPYALGAFNASGARTLHLCHNFTMLSPVQGYRLDIFHSSLVRQIPVHLPRCTTRFTRGFEICLLWPS